MAMLMTMKAKWYQREMEKTRVNTISYARLEAEQMNIEKNILR
jgi:hypothetical protein